MFVMLMVALEPPVTVMEVPLIRPDSVNPENNALKVQPVQEIAFAMVAVVVGRRVLLPSVSVPEPKPVALPSSTIPPLIVVPPEYVLAPLMSRVLDPCLMIEPAPLITPVLKFEPPPMLIVREVEVAMFPVAVTLDEAEVPVSEMAPPVKLIKVMLPGE